MKISEKIFNEKYEILNSEQKCAVDSIDGPVFVMAGPGTGKIRWVTIGVNIGSEIDGKGVSFTRPVLVLHVIGSKLALIVPMSTKMKDVPGYVPFTWKDAESSLCIHQMKVISQKRILKRKGKIADSKLSEIKKIVEDFYNF